MTKKQTPQIVVSRVGSRYGITVSGKFGGGYSVPPCHTLEEVAAMLARDAKAYDCSDEPIIITAPNEVRELVGLPLIPRGRPQVGEESFGAVTVSAELRAAMERKAEELGISLSEARRRAYQAFVS